MRTINIVSCSRAAFSRAWEAFAETEGREVGGGGRGVLEYEPLTVNHEKASTTLASDLRYLPSLRRKLQNFHTSVHPSLPCHELMAASVQLSHQNAISFHHTLILRSQQMHTPFNQRTKKKDTKWIRWITTSFPCVSFNKRNNSRNQNEPDAHEAVTSQELRQGSHDTSTSPLNRYRNKDVPRQKTRAKARRLTGSALNQGEHILHGSGGHPWLRGRPHHRVRLARPSVPVRENGGVIPSRIENGDHEAEGGSNGESKMQTD